jgi:hypothetical protein
VAALVGAPRFGPYLAAAHGDVRTALDLYVWNLCIGASFYGPLAILEVTVRNALHRELCALFGPSWHIDTGFQTAGHKVLSAIYPRSPGTRRPTFNTDLLAQPARVHSKLTAQLAKSAGTSRGGAAKLTPTTDDVVAGLDFGYWTSLLNRDVEPVLYAAGLYKAFPNAPRARGKAPARATVARKLNEIRNFRNRAMHHEPLFNRMSLRNDLGDIVDLCRWADTNAGDWVEYHSSLGEVLRGRFGARYTF